MAMTRQIGAVITRPMAETTKSRERLPPDRYILGTMNTLDGYESFGTSHPRTDSPAFSVGTSIVVSPILSLPNFD
jgi:hypothetical protein